MKEKNKIWQLRQLETMFLQLNIYCTWNFSAVWIANVCYNVLHICVKLEPALYERWQEEHHSCKEFCLRNDVTGLSI